MTDTFPAWLISKVDDGQVCERRGSGVQVLPRAFQKGAGVRRAPCLFWSLVPIQFS
jgi:hypothetical protein